MASEINITDDNRDAVMAGNICPYCGGKTKLVSSAKIYQGVDYGLVYVCWPCDAYVGVHKGTRKALGRLADKNLRRWKREAHSWFDPLWKKKMNQGYTKRVARDLAYRWLSVEMKLPFKDTHIGMFDIRQCRQVVKICKQAYKPKNQ